MASEPTNTTPPPVASPTFEIPAKASFGKVSDDAQTTAMKQHGTPSDAKDGGSLSPALVACVEALRGIYIREQAEAALCLAEAEMKGER